MASKKEIGDTMRIELCIEAIRVKMLAKLGLPIHDRRNIYAHWKKQTCTTHDIAQIARRLCPELIDKRTHCLLRDAAVDAAVDAGVVNRNGPRVAGWLNSQLRLSAKNYA